MLRVNLLVLIRQLNKYPVYYSLNFVGSTLSLTIVMLIGSFIRYEYSFDKFRTNVDNIYAIANKNTFGEWRGEVNIITPRAVAPTVNDRLSGQLKASRYLPGYVSIKYNDNELGAPVGFVDPTFPDVLSMNIIAGGPNNLLPDRNSILISKSIALQIFSAVDVVGKVVLANNRTFLVTGVFEDGEPTSLIPELYVHIDNFLKGEKEEDWDKADVMTFIKQNKGTSYELTRSALNDLANLSSSNLRKKLMIDFPELKSIPLFDLRLIPLSELHFIDKSPFLKNQGSSDLLLTLILVAALVLTITVINSLLLTQALIRRRLKEMAISTIFGAHPKAIFGRLFFESIISSLSALICAFIVGSFFKTYFTDFLNSSARLDLKAMPLVVGGVALIILLSTLTAVSSVWMLRAMSPLDAINVRERNILKPHLGSSVFVIAQFAIAIGFIGCALVVFRQVSFMEKKDKGLASSNLVQVSAIGVPIDGTIVRERLANALSSNPAVESIGSISDFPFFSEKEITLGAAEKLKAKYFYVSRNWSEVLGVELKKGLDFSKFATDTGAFVMVNESFANRFPQDVLGMMIDEKYKVVGVVKDFHYQDFTKEIAPTFFILGGSENEIFIRLKEKSDKSKFISVLKNAWESVTGESVVYYSFFDEYLSKSYSNDIRLLKMITYSSLLGILISCMGLFAVAGIDIHGRLRQVMIRKIFGANNYQLAFWLSLRYLIIIFISFGISVPFVMTFERKWTAQFVYAPPESFSWVLSLMLSLLIASATIGFHIKRSLSSEPIKVLKDD